MSNKKKAPFNAHYHFLMVKDRIVINSVKNKRSFVAVFKKALVEAERRAKVF